MKSTFKVLFYLKKDKISKDGKVPVMGRITVNGTQAGFSCKLNIAPALWDEKTNYLKSQRNTLSLEIHQNYIGKTMLVLVDGKDGDQLTARTEGGRLVRMHGDDALIGQFVHAKITGCTTWSLVGELAE